jgi:DHA1 family inner membrane transport protein
MTESTKSNAGGRYGVVSVTLFLCLFAGQAALIAMSPVLAAAASDLHVSTAAAGQLRTITGLAAGTTALVLGAVAGRPGLGRQLLAASALLAVASIASAAAPTFALLALAQLPVGVAVAVLTTAGTLAAAEWVTPELRTCALSWALVGQPAAWIVGMPLVGALGERSWRYGWLALPLAAAVAAGILVASRAGQPPARLRPARPHGPPRPHARALAGVRAARERRLGGNARLRGCALRRVVRDVHHADGLPARRRGSRVRRRQPDLPSPGVNEPQRILVLLAVLLAVTDGLFGAARTGIATSTALFASAAFVADGRTLVASGIDIATAPEIRPAATGLRAVAMQFGYFAGSIAGGAALSVGGYSALGVTMGALLLSATATLARRPTSPGASAERDSARARPRALLPALYRTRR